MRIQNVAVAAVIALAACAQDADVLSYKVVQTQPASSDLGVIVEVVAARSSFSHRSLSVRIAGGTLSIGGDAVGTAEAPFCESLGTSHWVSDPVDGPPLERILMTVTPTDQEAILSLGLHEGGMCLNSPLDSIVAPIQRPSEGNMGPDAGMTNAR